MNDKTFQTPVIIDTGSRADRDVKSLLEALDVLAAEWPADKRGSAYTEAMRSCRAALEGALPVEQARDAFSAAAWEAGIFVSDLRRMSDQAA
jgi:hypothetical protein